ncbi:MAG: hypothetical protein JWO77_2875 [Ilumatobacteraceae bacterium]|nr:hypothetical protein [Ilumatobacteraceae bacterium]
MIRRALPALAALVALGLALAVTGCSSGDDAGGSTTTAMPASTTTTRPEITDEEIIDNINEDLRPSLDGAFEPKAVDCIISVLEDGGIGELDADEVVPEYEARCGVTATKVTGVITGAALVEQGATPEQGLCIADAIAKLTYDQVAAFGETETNALYASCDIDVDALASPVAPGG